MKTLQVSMKDEVTADWERVIAQIMEKMGEGAKKGDAMESLLKYARKALTSEVSPTTSPYTSAIDVYLSGIASQADALARLYAAREKTYDEEKAEELKAINGQLTAKAAELAEAERAKDEIAEERDAAIRERDEALAALAEQEQRAMAAEAQCELLEEANRDLQQSIVAIAAAVERTPAEGE